VAAEELLQAQGIKGCSRTVRSKRKRRIKIRKMIRSRSRRTSKRRGRRTAEKGTVLTIAAMVPARNWELGIG
jgi:hypothetical protein